MPTQTKPTGTDAAASRNARVAKLIVTTSMLALVLLQALAGDWTVAAGNVTHSDPPSAAVVALLRSI